MSTTYLSHVPWSRILELEYGGGQRYMLHWDKLLRSLAYIFYDVLIIAIYLRHVSYYEGAVFEMHERYLN
jgi:hypothetical protein